NIDTAHAYPGDRMAPGSPGTRGTHSVDELLGTVGGGDHPIHRGRLRTRRPGVSSTAVGTRLRRIYLASGGQCMVAGGSPLWSGGVPAAVVHHVASTQRNGDRHSVDALLIPPHRMSLSPHDAHNNPVASLSTQQPARAGRF